MTDSPMVIPALLEGGGRQRSPIGHVVDHFVTDGLGDLSLRKIAAAVGTSHRMLLYHFGSKNGLLLEVVPRSRPAPESAPRRSGRDGLAGRTI